MTDDKRKRYRLTNIEVQEVSLVEKPANTEARVVLFKSATPKNEPVTRAEWDAMVKELEACGYRTRKIEMQNISKADAHAAALDDKKEAAAKAWKPLVDERQVEDLEALDATLSKELASITQALTRDGIEKHKAFALAIQAVPHLYDEYIKAQRSIMKGDSLSGFAKSARTRGDVIERIASRVRRCVADGLRADEALDIVKSVSVVDYD